MRQVANDIFTDDNDDEPDKPYADTIQMNIYSKQESMKSKRNKFSTQYCLM